MKNRITTAEHLMSQQVTYEGSKYQPVTHKEAIETIKEQLYKHNFILTSEEYLSASGGQRAIGKYGIKYNGEMDYMIAFGNSLDGSLAFRLAMGSIVKVCSNGNMFGNEMNMKKKHFMGNNSILLLEHIEIAINSIEEVMKKHLEIKKSMEEVEIDKKVKAALIGDLFLNEEAIQATQLSIIKKEIENPSFNYGNPNSLWSLYNYSTFAAKQQTPILWQKQHEELGQYFVNAQGLLVNKQEIQVPEEIEYILDGEEVKEV